MTSELKFLLKKTEAIKGWLSKKEAVFLFLLSKKIPSGGVIVEIGSYKGKSTIFLGSGIKPIKKARLYAIDPHVGSPEKPEEYMKTDTSKEFLENIEKFNLKEKVFLIKKTSKKASDGFLSKIDLLFIDGSHLYEDVLEDFVCWIPKVKKNGWVVVHDATVLSGPWKATKKHLILSFGFRNIGMIGSMIFGRKAEPKGTFGGIINLIFNFFSYLYIISYVIIRKIVNILRNK